MSMFLSYVSLVLALSCIYCTTSFGELKMFNIIEHYTDNGSTVSCQLCRLQQGLR